MEISARRAVRSASSPRRRWCPLPAKQSRVARHARSLYVPADKSNRFFPNEPVMADQIVITEKFSQAKDVRAAVGSRYGDILPAEGHLLDLLEPEDVVPAWKRWSPILLRPEGLYGTRPAQGGNKAAKLTVIREALRTAKRVWLATDCDREGQLIGQEILEHYEYRGQVMRVLFTAQDQQTIRDAFGRAKPNAEYARLYAAAVARRQADQIYNLSLTRTATVILGQGARRVIGVGRVKTPTLAIVCKRELEIRNFVPLAYFEVVAAANVAGGQFQMRSCGRPMWWPTFRSSPTPNGRTSSSSTRRCRTSRSCDTRASLWSARTQQTQQSAVLGGAKPRSSGDHLRARGQDGAPEPRIGTGGHYPGNRQGIALPRARDALPRAQRRRHHGIWAVAGANNPRRAWSGPWAALAALRGVGDRHRCAGRSPLDHHQHAGSDRRRPGLYRGTAMPLA